MKILPWTHPNSLNQLLQSRSAGCIGPERSILHPSVKVLSRGPRYWSTRPHLITPQGAARYVPTWRDYLYETVANHNDNWWLLGAILLLVYEEAEHRQDFVRQTQWNSRRAAARTRNELTVCDLLGRTAHLYFLLHVTLLYKAQPYPFSILWC